MGKINHYFLFTAELLTTFCSIANVTFWNLSDSPYGINAHLPDNRTLDFITSVGIKWVRMSISWALIEEVKGVRNWGFGILNWDYSPKEAYYSYQSLLNEAK